MFTLKECCVHELYGYYVDSEKNIRSEWEQSFLNLPDGKTIGEYMAPQIETAYQTGTMPPMLPML